MVTWARIGMGAGIRGGTLVLTYVLLSPAIWSRSVFDGFEIAAALAIGSGVLVDAGAEPVRMWARYVVMTSVGFAATLVTGAVVIAASLGDESALTSMQQRIAFGTSVVIAVGFWLWLSRATRFGAFADPDRETRQNAIRANIRKEIDEIERAAGDRPDSTQSMER